MSVKQIYDIQASDPVIAAQYMNINWVNGALQQQQQQYRAPHKLQCHVINEDKIYSSIMCSNRS
jgi:hypothetical protein